MTLLKYPATIDGSSDYMLFEFGTYEPPYKGGAVSYNTEQTFNTKGSSIALNMPNSIGSAFSGAWAGKDVTSLAAAALGKVASPIAQSLAKGDTDSALTALMKDPATSFKGTAKAVGDDFLKFLGEGFQNLPGLGGNIGTNDILQLTTGKIINPNTELLYGGPSLRSHGYGFKLIPQSRSEADEVLKIVQAFKEACLPSEGGAFGGTKGRNFINIPDICRVKFMQGSTQEENPNLPKI